MVPVSDDLNNEFKKLLDVNPFYPTIARSPENRERLNELAEVMMMWRVEHYPSGDWAEAEDAAGADLAAVTLLDDNEREGRSTIYCLGRQMTLVWYRGDAVCRL